MSNLSIVCLGNSLSLIQVLVKMINFKKYSFIYVIHIFKTIDIIF